MSRLLVAGAYMTAYWIAKPIAEVIAWVWTRWDNLQNRRYNRLMDPVNWYHG